MKYYIHYTKVATIFGRLSHNVISHDAGGGEWGVVSFWFSGVFLNLFMLIFCEHYEQWAKYTLIE